MEEAVTLRAFLFRHTLAPLLAALLFSGALTRASTVSDSTRAADLVELVRLDSTFRLDIRYATPDNFTGRAVYTSARAFLERPAAEALVRVQNTLRARGYGLLIFDAYRPWSVTKTFWDLTPPSKRKYVANPQRGSRHNRGCAVDCSLVRRDSRGAAVEMPSAFDDFTERASADYPGGTPAQRQARDLLRRAMESEGFTVNPDEWWHFDFNDWQEYPLLDLPFEALP